MTLRAKPSRRRWGCRSTSCPTGNAAARRSRWRRTTPCPSSPRRASSSRPSKRTPDKVTTLCAICYNVLKRTEFSLRKHPEQLERINWFVSTDETTAGQTYTGKVQVTHFLQQLRDDLGWKALSERVTQPLKGLKVAPYYGCLLLRPPAEIGLDDPDQPTILADLLTALGAEPVDFPFKGECCGSYLAVNKPDVPAALSGTIVESAAKHGAQAIVTACPLCQYNLDVKGTIADSVFYPVAC